MGTRRGRTRGGAEARDRRVPEHFQEVLLRNNARRRIMEIIDRRPGLNKHQIAKETDMNPSSAEFHVRRLHEHGLVELRPGVADEREELCFTKENVRLWEESATRMLFGRGATRRVAAYLNDHPGADVKELAIALDLAPASVRRHLGMLQRADLVQQMRIERNVIYHVEPELAEWIEATAGIDAGGRNDTKRK